MNNDKSLTRKDIELFMMAQFIDVINVFERYETIDEVKKDVKARKQIYLNYIKQMSLVDKIEISENKEITIYYKFNILNMRNEDNKLENVG